MTSPDPNQVVYRFDGFLPPINDTARSAGSTSVFKAKSTVPVKLQLKDHNGNIVQAKNLPVWILPTQAVPTSAPIDEVEVKFQHASLAILGTSC